MASDAINVPDPSSRRGGHVVQRLESDLIGWLTTVAPDGTPQVSPIWFHWDGDEFLVYSKESTRVTNIEGHSKVSLNLDGNGRGGDIVVVEGEARIDRSYRPPPDHPEYVAKYIELMEGYGWTLEYFAQEYPVPVLIRPTRYRFW